MKMTFIQSKKILGILTAGTIALSTLSGCGKLKLEEVSTSLPKEELERVEEGLCHFETSMDMLTIENLKSKPLEEKQYEAINRYLENNISALKFQKVDMNLVDLSQINLSLLSSLSFSDCLGQVNLEKIASWKHLKGSKPLESLTLSGISFPFFLKIPFSLEYLHLSFRNQTQVPVFIQYDSKSFTLSSSVKKEVPILNNQSKNSHLWLYGFQTSLEQLQPELYDLICLQNVNMENQLEEIGTYPNIQLIDVTLGKETSCFYHSSVVDDKRKYFKTTSPKEFTNQLEECIVLEIPLEESSKEKKEVPTCYFKQRKITTN